MSETDLVKLYSGRILALAADMPATEPLTDPQVSVRKRSPLCGSTVTVSLDVEDGRIIALGAAAALQAQHPDADTVALRAGPGFRVGIWAQGDRLRSGAGSHCPRSVARDVERRRAGAGCAVRRVGSDAARA